MKIIDYTTNDVKKNLYLEQRTFGQQKQDIIRSQLPKWNNRVQSCCEELEERYGDQEIIASAFVSRALD